MLETLWRAPKRGRKKFSPSNEAMPAWLGVASGPSNSSMRDRRVNVRPSDASTIHPTTSASASRIPAFVNRNALPSKMRWIACPTSTGCCEANSKRSRALTGSVSAYSSRNIAANNHAAAAKLHRQAISANGIMGRRKRMRNPSAVGEKEAMPRPF